MPMTKKKVAGRLKKRVRTPRRPAARAAKRTPKKRSQMLRKKIETGQKKIAPRGESLEVLEVVETQVFDEPLIVELDAEES